MAASASHDLRLGDRTGRGGGVETVNDRLSAALADRYRIERELGQGGMATVYLAADLKHDRKVALKVLRPELAAVLGADRFVVEIKTTAALQHPHILPLFDSGTADGFLYYVMPYVEGETLRDKLNRETQLGIEEAVRITREVADALDYAHRHGVIHRDIKPENILLHDGRPMVADFGIALALSAAAGGRMTETGMSLGTPHYMSPEQATAEKDLTNRSDIYSLGSVLYEMLTVNPPHTGASAQQIIMKIVTDEARPVTELRKSVPANVAAAVSKSLERLPADRFASAAEFAAALGNPAFATVATRVHPVLAADHRAVLLAWVLAALAIAGAAWGWLRPAVRPVSRFAVGFPRGQALDITPDGTHLAISADGSTLVYVGGDSTVSRLWVKRQDQLAAVPIPGTEGAYDPFPSPDGSQVGFFSERNGRALRRVAVAGGAPQVVAQGHLGVTGASWSTDGYIYFDADLDGLQRVRPDGSGRETVVVLDTARKEAGIAWPQVLPGGRIVIMRLRHAADDPSTFDIIAERIGTGQRGTVVRTVTARYAAGRLLYVTADGTLLSAPFDERRLALSGAPTVVATGVRVAGSYPGVDLAVSERGTVYYVAGPAGLSSHLEWVARDGAREPVDTAWQEHGAIGQIALSPDGTRVAVTLQRLGVPGSDIWVKQLPSGALTRLTIDPGFAFAPSWSADGRSVLFVSDGVTPAAAYRHRADGLGGDSLVLRSDHPAVEVVESSDGRWLVARVSDVNANVHDIVAERLGRDTTPAPLIAGPAAEVNPALSPDGRWIAYVSDVSGRPEVYVRPFPDVDGGQWQVSLHGGVIPKWSHAGRTLFFRDLDGITLFAADVSTSPTFHPGQPRQALRVEPGSGLDLRAGFELSRDDRRFLMVGHGAANTESQLVRIENGLSERPRSRTP